MATIYIDNDEELHELILTTQEIEERPDAMTASDYLVEEACKKANRLGKEKKKIKRVFYKNDKNIGWIVSYICESDKWL